MIAAMLCLLLAQQPDAPAPGEVSESRSGDRRSGQPVPDRSRAVGRAGGAGGAAVAAAAERDVARRRGRSGHRQPAGGDHAPVPRSSSRRAGRASPTRPSTRRRSSRSAARWRARAPTTRPSATCCACSATAPSTPTSPPPIGRWSTRRWRRASRRRSWRCSKGSSSRIRCRATARTSARICAARSPTKRATCGRGGQTFGEVDRQSRFHASALYFRGLIAARQQRFAMARRNLCEIVEQADKDRFSFFIDGRYYAIKDLAYLALGPHRARAGQVRRRLLLLLPRARGFGAAARRAVRGGVVDVPEGRVRGGRRVHRAVRSHVPEVAAGARRDAAARDDRPQVVPVREGAHDAGPAGEDLRADRGRGRGADQGSRAARGALSPLAEPSRRSATRAIASSSC